MDKFMEKIKGTKILGIIGNLILAVAVFLPVLNCICFIIWYITKSINFIYPR